MQLAPGDVLVEIRPGAKCLVNVWLYYTLAIVLVLACGVCWLANLFTLPGNWGIAALVALFAWLVPSVGSRGVSFTSVGILVALAAVGEAIEFAAGAVGAAKVGASRRSIWYSLVGAMAGSIGGAAMGMPIPVIGSLVAALVGGSLGAFAGAYLGESSLERTHGERVAVGKGAVIGRLWGTVGKFAVGAAMVAVAGVDALFV
jgi:uncharacterized protein YqgC (DUF456 family)